jgi:DNA polymerase-3 subunit epsilon/ATP-dependent DNA helicase DinG
LDLETTGLDCENDSIIEIGAVRFSLEGVIDEFSTLVNPGRPVPPVIERLTGITDRDLASAPPIEVVASDVEEFLAGSVLVGHNVCGFDVPVLDAQAIKRPFAIYDTQALAEVLMPTAGNYGLADLTAKLSLGFEGHHRARNDADAARRLLLALFDRALSLPSETLSTLGQLLTPTDLPWRGFFRDAWDLRNSRQVQPSDGRTPVAEQRQPVRPSRSDLVEVPADESVAVLRLASQRRDVFEAFEERPQQADMLCAVAECLNHRGHLLVEAGTGTGKSLAYLLPAAAQTVANGTRAVISTSTINLQDQLAKKDVPAVQELMGGRAPAACQLKGRRNYLCLKRFDAQVGGASLSDEEAKLAARILVWLEETEAGDRGEIRISPEEEWLWTRLSADGAECSSDNSPFVVDGSCFLQKARRRAEASHIVVVNHSLLLSDAAIGGHVIPPFHHLVVDEAHHLEDEASRQFGFSCRQKDMLGLADRCTNLTRQLLTAAKESPPASMGAQVATAASAVREETKPVRAALQVFYDLLAGFVADHAPPGEEGRLHLKRSARAQARWSDIEVAWDNAGKALGALGTSLGRLAEELNGLGPGAPPNIDIISSDAFRCLDDATNFRAGVQVAVESDDPLRITWLEIDRADGGVTVSWVPLDVSSRLQESLYLEERSVIFTGATLQSGNDFRYIQQRLGITDCDTLALGSPFDYGRQALVVIGEDMPEPNHPASAESVSQAVHDLARASGGRALVLFTSNSALRGVHRLVSDDLAKEGIAVLGQNIDGSARQLVRALQSNPATVLLGTSSFWEGVDIPGEHLSLLVITRLPFPVPTDPVQAARSEQYEDAFEQYMLPQAVIRFKQGFGRLIRSRTDRGVVVVLDPRITTRRYGETFLQSLPGCPVQRMRSRDMAPAVESFLASSSAPAR